MKNINDAIKEECDAIAAFLQGKNESYGNSVGDPIKCFSQLDASARIAVRLDDKLSRLMRGGTYPGDDSRLDLLGYLVLERVLLRVKEDTK